MDRTIYIPFNGKLTKVKEPIGNPENANFVITYSGRDWSGFRTLAECEMQFPSIEQHKRLEEFAVIER